MSRQCLTVEQTHPSKLSAQTQGIEILLSEFGRVKFTTIATLCVLMLSVLATLSGPMLVQHFVDRAVASGTSSELSSLALIYSAVALFGGVTRVGANYLGLTSSPA